MPELADIGRLQHQMTILIDKCFPGVEGNLHKQVMEKHPIRFLLLLACIDYP